MGSFHFVIQICDFKGEINDHIEKMLFINKSLGCFQEFPEINLVKCDKMTFETQMKEFCVTSFCVVALKVIPRIALKVWSYKGHLSTITH